MVDVVGSVLGDVVDSTSSFIMAAKISSDEATTITSSDPRTADELISDSEANRKEATRLYESIETIDDPEEMMAALDKAEQLEAQADAEMERAKQLDTDRATVGCRGCWFY